MGVSDVLADIEADASGADNRDSITDLFFVTKYIDIADEAGVLVPFLIRG